MMDKNSTQPKAKQNQRRRRISLFVALLLGLSALALVTARGETPSFTDPSGQPVSNSIAEERRMALGGVDQYVLLRGRDRSAPLLVYVHGGPGASATPFLRTYNSDLEDDFLMVYWDQRGAAKSFDPNLDSAAITIDNIVNDLSELIDQLLIEFEQDQVLLVAHSWGTIPALEYVNQRPETVAAYVAISQTTNQIESDAEGVQWALEEAKRVENSSAINALESIGLPPYDIDAFNTQRRFVNVLGGGLVEPQTDFDLLRTAIGTSEFAWTDTFSFVRGVSYSSAALWPEQQQYDAFSQHPDVSVPFVMMLGRHDRIISPSLGSQYFDLVNAPEKELIWFESSAHSPHFEEPEKFNDMIKEIAKEAGL